MNRVVAIILHPVPPSTAGPLVRAFANTRAANARRQVRGFEAAGALARVIDVQPGGAPFGARLRRLAALDDDAGIVVLGSGSIPLARPADWRTFVAAAARPGGAVVANNRYSADVIALPVDVDLASLPDLTADNGLPRWLAERGREVLDLGQRWRLQADLDSPLDAFLTGLGDPADSAFARVREAADGLRLVASDPKAELLVAGRTSAATLLWLERTTSSRTRGLVEERGLRTSAADQRPPRSSLGLILDRTGPGALGDVLRELADGALVDTRVLLAHRLGADEAGWPPADDRFASDLLDPDSIADPWLRELTHSAVGAAIPVLLGGHTLVGPAVRLVLGPRRRTA